VSAAEVHPTRIAMDVTALLGPTTGVGAMVRAVAERLPEAVCRSLHGDGDPSASVELTGYVVSVRGRNELASVIPDGWRPLPLPYPARLAHRLWRSVNVPTVSGFDLVHGPNYVVPPAGDAARLVTVHDLTAWRFPEMVSAHSQFYPEHLRRAVAGGAHVHAVSHFVANELVDDLGLPAGRVHVAENGYEADLSGKGDAARGRAAVGAPYVLVLGTVEPRKDHVGLVKAMLDVWTRLPEIKLAIVGPDGWASEALSETIDGLDCRDRIVRLGYVDGHTKRDLLAGAELLAFPSKYEGFGLPILEAMGAGVPVVSTTAGAIPEVAGHAALLVAPGDSTAMAEAIQSIVLDESLRGELVAEGRRNVQRYSWDRSATRLAGIYATLLAERSGVHQVDGEPQMRQTVASNRPADTKYLG
jgi:glycosyltransferase involved in cell wall biosynthesis